MRKLRYLLAIPAAAAAVLAVTLTPAGAAPTWPGQNVNTVCESFGPQNCLGSDDLQYGTYVEEKNPPGRTISLVANDTGGQLLKFINETNKCVGLNSGSRTAIKECSGTTGIVWTVHWDNGHFTAQNNYTSLWLTCSGTVGVYCVGWMGQNPPPGYLQKFDNPQP